MKDFPASSTSKPAGHNKWLILISAYKVGQALLFVAIGVGALRLLHKDIEDVLTQLATDLRFNPESHFVNFLLEKASILDDHLLRRISAMVFFYAGLSLIEGVGLYLEKIWAEYLTLLITGSFLPWEIYELVRRQTWPRFSLLTLNVLVFLYLLRLVVERRKKLRK